jgi:hypothetical protein
MKATVMMAAVAAMALAAGSMQVQAQSLEESYATQCATPAAKQTEMCQVMAKALMARPQGESAPAPAPTADLRGRWGFLLDFIGKPTFQINGETGSADTASRWILEWQVPGEVLVRRKLGPDGAELGSITYTWSKFTDAVERNVAAIGQVQTFSVEANGNFTGTLLMNGTVGRERWESLGPTGYRVTTETNAGRGWVLGGDSMWQLSTSDALAGAAQSAALMAQMYRNKKATAEIKAQMQGGMTDAEFDKHIADLEILNQERREARRARKAASSARWNQALGALYNGLSAANEIASESEAQSRAALEATLAQAAYQSRPSPVGDAGAPVARTAAATTPLDRSPNSDAAHPGAAAQPAKPLRFVLDISLVNKPGDTVNPTCYSNVITVPGPPGWGGTGFLPEGSAAQARQAVEDWKGRFLQACRSSGREIAGEGNFHWTWNESRDGDQQVDNAHARYREDVSVNL